MKKSTRNKFKGFKCLVCQNPEIDLCHVKSKGSGGPDEEWNLMPLCREHHQEQHRVGIVTFYCRYFLVSTHMHLKGWRLEEIINKPTLVHPKLEAIYDRV